LGKLTELWEYPKIVKLRLKFSGPKSKTITTFSDIFLITLKKRFLAASF